MCVIQVNNVGLRPTAYRALADTTFELIWLRWLRKDLGVSICSATPLYCDNQSVIHITHNDVFHERTKHIEIDCH